MELSKIIHFSITDSTQQQAKRARQMLVPDQCMLFTADAQITGKGTHHKLWFSPPHVNLYATYAYLTAKENDHYLINIPQIAA